MNKSTDDHPALNNNTGAATMKKAVIAAGVALLLMLSGIVYQTINNNQLAKERDEALLQKEFILSEKLNFEKEYNNAREQMESLKGKNEELDKLIAEKAEELEAFKKKTEKMMRENAGIAGLKKQIAELKKINSDFEAQANLLIKQNAELTAQVGTLKGQNEQLSTKMLSLDERIERAKQLRACNIDIKTIKITHNGKEISTAKARKTNRISVDFDIVENLFATSGEKNIQVLIKDPAGMALMENADGENFLVSIDKAAITEFNKYTKTMMVNYKNTDHHVTVNYDYNKKLKLKDGRYTLEIYVDGKLSGKKDFSLK